MTRPHLLKVWETSDAKGASLLVLMALADMAADDGTAEVSMQELAGRSRLTPRYVVNMLKQLVADGRIERLRGGGGESSARFRFLDWEAIAGPEAKKLAQEVKLQAEEVFEYWRAVCHKKMGTLFDDKRRRRVEWALKHYGLEAVKAAIDWYAADEWHIEHGQNDLALIFRDAAHAERYLEDKPKPKVPAMPYERPWPAGMDSETPGVPMPPEVREQLQALGLLKAEPPTCASAGGS